MNKILAVVAWMAAAQAQAGEGVQGLTESLSRMYPGARIVLTSTVKRADTGAELALRESGPKLEALTSNGRGEARFRVGEVPAAVSFRAMVPAWLTVKRVRPGEKLSADQFIEQEVNVASGMEYELRGVILSTQTKIDGLEARQSILEGQYVTGPAVQRMPDVRKGDSVRVLLVAGGVTLSTSGTAEEPAFMEQSLKITAMKTKRLLVGKLVAPGVVEVAL